MHLPLTFSGVGPEVTKAFCLAKGTYRTTATYTTDSGSNFIVHLFNRTDIEDVVFNELESAAGTYHYETAMESETTGDHFLEIEAADGAWTITIRAI